MTNVLLSLDAGEDEEEEEEVSSRFRVPKKNFISKTLCTSLTGAGLAEDKGRPVTQRPAKEDTGRLGGGDRAA